MANVRKNKGDLSNRMLRVRFCYVVPQSFPIISMMNMSTKFGRQMDGFVPGTGDI